MLRALLLLATSLAMAATEPPVTLTIVPPSGSYPATWRADVAFVVQSTEPVLSQTVHFDTTDVTQIVMAHCQQGTLTSGGLTLRCASQFGSGGVARSGTHTLRYTVVTASGSYALSNRYTILGASE